METKVTQNNSIEKYVLHYPGNETVCRNFPSLEQCLGYVWDVNEEFTGKDPEAITLPNGLKIVYNPYLSHQFVGKGKISEAEFIEMSETCTNQQSHG